MWRQSPICHLPVILFGLLTGSFYCSLKSEMVGQHVLLKQHKNYGKFRGKTGGRKRLQREGYREDPPL